MGEVKKGKLRSIRIEPAQNGYAIHAEHEPPPMPAGKKGGGEMAMPMPTQPMPHLATSRHGAMKHISSLMAAHEGADGDGMNEPDGDETEPENPLASALRRKR